MRKISYPRRRLAAPAALLVTLAAAACGGGGGSGASTGPKPNPQPSPNQITVKATTSLAFSPASVTVAPGGKVEFEFGTTAHTVNFNGVAGAPADIPSTSSATVERTFSTAGTYQFHCTIHPGMSGTVVVAATTSGTGAGGDPGCGYYGCP